MEDEASLGGQTPRNKIPIFTELIGIEFPGGEKSTSTGIVTTNLLRLWNNF